MPTMRAEAEPVDHVVPDPPAPRKPLPTLRGLPPVRAPLETLRQIPDLPPSGGRARRRPSAPPPPPSEASVRLRGIGFEDPLPEFEDVAFDDLFDATVVEWPPRVPDREPPPKSGIREVPLELRGLARHLDAPEPSAPSLNAPLLRLTPLPEPPAPRAESRSRDELPTLLDPLEEFPPPIRPPTFGPPPASRPPQLYVPTGVVHPMGPWSAQPTSFVAPPRDEALSPVVRTICYLVMFTVTVCVVAQALGLHL
jgi:hypothetical protein